MSPLFPHGGPRNSASRSTDALTMQQVQGLIAATNRALAIGRPLNRWITVHWEATGLRDTEAMRATTAFLKYWREWLHGETAYIWVRENGEGKGSHLHVLAHLPLTRPWHGKHGMRWIERITGCRYKAGVILSKRIAGSGHCNGPLYSSNLHAVLAYSLKSAAPDVANSHGIRHQPGGLIIGKRCGISRNLGK